MTGQQPERRGWAAALRPSGDEAGGPSAEGDLATNVTAYLLAGPLAFGGAGWVASRWLHQDWPIPVGVLAGLGLSVYVIWLRYGRT